MERSEDKASRRHDELHTLADMMNCGVLLLDAHAGLQFASAHAWRLLGYKNQASVKKDWPRVCQKLDLPQVAELKQASEPIRFKIDFPLVNGAPGKTRLLRLEIYPFERESRSSFLVLLKDRQVLDDLGLQLLLASQIHVQSYLASAFVHDLNAPINNIQLTLELLKASMQNNGALSSELQQRLQRYQTVLKEEVVRLSGLIKSLPNELNPPKTEAEPFDLRTVVDDVMRRLKHEASARQIRRSLGSSPVALMINGSQGQIRLALFGLAIVMLEATRPGGTLTIKLEKTAAGAHIDLQSDNAQPVSDFSTLQQLFVLSQSDVFAARLAIESHGGDVIAEEQAGEGARVRVLLPLMAEQPMAASTNMLAESK